MSKLMSELEDTTDRANMVEQRFPRKKVKTCWGCKFSWGEGLCGMGPALIQTFCEQRYAGFPKGEGELIDRVYDDEVCPLWEGRVGKMPVYDVPNGRRNGKPRMEPARR